MDAEMLAAAREAPGLDAFRWMVGMRFRLGKTDRAAWLTVTHVYISSVEARYPWGTSKAVSFAQLKSATLHLACPATRGCLLELVRTGWRTPNAATAHILGEGWGVGSTDGTGWRWLRRPCGINAEGVALVAALRPTPRET